MSFLDLSEVEVRTFDNKPVPPGDYVASIKKIESRDAQTGGGKYFNVQLQVVGGEHKGKTIFTMMNYQNQNHQAVKIGKEQIKSMLIAAGIENNNFQSMQDFIESVSGKIVMVKTDIKKDNKGNDQAHVKYFHKADAKKDEAPQSGGLFS